MEHTKLSRTDASEAVTGLGWRYVLGEFRTQVLTGSLPLAADVAGRAAVLPDVEGHLRMDIRADRLLLSLQTAEVGLFASEDSGTTWSPTNQGPTNCPVDDLFWMGETLVSVTHGRGMYRIDLSGV